ncbi:MAG: outer membrane protein transport protein [Proteobacteria bacterium]|nr:outer membrane protein transport protein [Pseudomonadota bacterium]
MQRSTISRLVAGVLALAASGAASAAGFQLLEQNASGIGNAYAGSAAVAENASTIFFNPAGMTQLPARALSIGLAAVKPSFKFSNDGSQTGVLTGNTSDAGGWAAIPNAYLSWALNKDVYVGVGLGAPFGLMTEYDNDWVGAAHSTKFDIKTYNINPSIAWRVNELVSLGAGVSWQRMEVEYGRRAGAVPGLSTTDATLKADDDSWGWNLGVLFILSPATKVGFSYRSAIEQDLKGTLRFKGSASGSSPLLVDSGAGATVKLPDTWILSGAHAIDDRWEVLGDVSWTGWSNIQEVDIMRTSGVLVGTPFETAQKLETRFRDTWRVAMGANYRLNDAWRIKAGVAYDQTPVRDASRRLTSLPDEDRTWFSVGAQWKADKASALDLGLAYLYVPDTGIRSGEPIDPAVRKLRGFVKGNYDSSVWILGAQYSMSF